MTNIGTENRASEKTRRKILESAGKLIAERGFDRTTAKDICAKAGVSPAAVNYYFGSRNKLYEAVLQDAHRGIITLEQMDKALPRDAPSEEKLRVLLELLMGRLFSASRGGWRFQVLIREMVAPTPAIEYLMETEFKPKTMFLRGIISEMLGLPVEHALVNKCFLSIFSQLLALFQNRQVFAKLFTEMDFENDPHENLLDHVVAFSIGGIRNIAEKFFQDGQAR